MEFASDNGVGASQKVLDAIIAANTGATPAYGSDDLTKRAEAMLKALFERDTASFLVATGTGANALALGAIAPPWGAIFCHEDAHIIDDECGAPEMFTSGAKLVGIAGLAGKIRPDGLRETLARFPHGLVKQVQPAALSLSQATECGTLYNPDEIAALAKIAHGAGMRVHMDGARFANALVGVGCTPAEMTWRSGIDVLSFGATKNGALACEAVIFFDKVMAQDFLFRRKRGGHTLSKGRFLGAQMIAYLEGAHWRGLAQHSNRCASRLATGLASIPGVRIPWPTQANEVFAVLPRTAERALSAAGALYHDWGSRSLPADKTPREHEAFVRLVCSFATREDEIDEFVALARRACKQASNRVSVSTLP